MRIVPMRRLIMKKSDGWFYVACFIMGSIVGLMTLFPSANAEALEDGPSTALSDAYMMYIGTKQPTAEESFDCAVTNAYFETRNQSDLGVMTVMHVVLNRVMDSRFRDNICSVVYTSNFNIAGHPLRNKCHFSWFCDGKPDKMLEATTVIRMQELVSKSIHLYRLGVDLAAGATHYHAANVTPYWVPQKKYVGRVDDHLLYIWEK